MTINANQASRIFNITATTGDFTLGGLTLTGGRTTAGGTAGSGGAIRSLITGNLTLDQSTVSGSSTLGIAPTAAGFLPYGCRDAHPEHRQRKQHRGKSPTAAGFGTSGSVTLTQSTVSGNSTAGIAPTAAGFVPTAP